MERTETTHLPLSQTYLLPTTRPPHIHTCIIILSLIYNILACLIYMPTSYTHPHHILAHLIYIPTSYTCPPHVYTSFIYTHTSYTHLSYIHTLLVYIPASYTCPPHVYSYFIYIATSYLPHMCTLLIYTSASYTHHIICIPASYTYLYVYTFIYMNTPTLACLLRQVALHYICTSPTVVFPDQRRSDEMHHEVRTVYPVGLLTVPFILRGGGMRREGNASQRPESGLTAVSP